eukprot:COSAG01_NODE_50619_length_361_cov_47.152672_1_plen_85_part_10
MTVRMRSVFRTTNFAVNRTFGTHPSFGYPISTGKIDRRTGEADAEVGNQPPGRQLLDEDIGVITSSTRNSCPGRQLEDIGVFTSS